MEPFFFLSVIMHFCQIHQTLTLWQANKKSQLATKINIVLSLPSISMLSWFITLLLAKSIHYFALYLGFFGIIIFPCLLAMMPTLFFAETKEWREVRIFGILGTAFLFIGDPSVCR